ncbi:MAG: hypothetical protein AB8F95_09935 [Bacteroidia bacterium]
MNNEQLVMNNERLAMNNKRAFPFSLCIVHCTLFIILSACQPPVAQTGTDGNNQTQTIQAFEALDVAARELQELSRPAKLKVWVEKLNFRSWPGTDATILQSLKKDDQLKYLFQRTIRQESHTYGSQSYLDSWLLVKVGEQVGWVHGGGVVGVPSGLAELFAPNNNNDALPPDANKRSIGGDPSFTAPVNSAKLDYLIIPGKQVGNITLTTSEDQLLRQHGANISRGTVEKLPGESEACTILNEGEKDELRITWKDENRTKIKAVYVERAGGHWYLKPGVFVGQAISDVSKLNGAPVKFYGFGGRYGGVTESFSNGRLQSMLKHGYLVIGSKGGIPADLRGDQVFISSQKEVATRSLQVTRMVVYLD